MSMSLSRINNRDPRGLLYNVKNARMSTFWTPSSFYIQLIEEDEFYNNLEAEMLAYYNGVAVYSYCCKLSGETPDNPALNKLKIQFLTVSIHGILIFIIEQYLNLFFLFFSLT